jgi:hypothetical protein
MRRLLPLLLSLLTLAISPASPAGGAEQSDPPRLFCDHPRTLRLHRFEDRSATVECGGHVIARVSVPG